MIFTAWKVCALGLISCMQMGLPSLPGMMLFLLCDVLAVSSPDLITS